MQLEKPGQSVLAFDLKGANCSDAIFRRWAKKQLEITLGLSGALHQSMQASHAGAGSTTDEIVGSIMAQYGAQMVSLMQ